MSVRILTGDCRELLRTLPAESVYCVVTSPPYYGLRDYGVAGQIGLEETPAEYLKQMVAVFREVRRVLRDDGTLWLNLGDSYASGEVGRHDGYNPTGLRRRRPSTSSRWLLRDDGTLWLNLGDSYASGEVGRHDGYNPTRANGSGTRKLFGERRQEKLQTGLKPKDLVGIPWRVAFALQADGWYLRQDIIWHKPNPMPESVRDRCTKAHEYIFLLSKRERYHYDAAAILEQTLSLNDSHPSYRPNSAHIARDGRRELQNKHEITARTYDEAGRNKRSVWTVNPQPFAGAHFATFPPALIEPCIKAGCPAGGTVLDCFGGAGTTGLVADRLGRDAILIEMNPEYAEMARRRIRDDAPMFADRCLTEPVHT